MMTALAFSADGKRLATGGNDTTVLLWDLTGRAGEEAAKGKLTAEDAVKLWTALGDSDARAAHRALRRLEASPEEALALLTKQLQSGDKGGETDSIAKLIAALDSDSFEERQKAASDLAALGKVAAPALKKALADKPSAEARRAITELLAKMSDKSCLPPEQVRPLRVVELLENLGSPEAKKLLETLAKGRAERRRPLPRRKRWNDWNAAPNRDGRGAACGLAFASSWDGATLSRKRPSVKTSQIRPPRTPSWLRSPNDSSPSSCCSCSASPRGELRRRAPMPRVIRSPRAP